MESSSFIQPLLNDINTFRQTPNSLNKRFENVKLTMSRFKGNEQFVKDIEHYLNFLNSSKGVSPVTVVYGLNVLAKRQLEHFERIGKIQSVVNDEELAKRASLHVEGYDRIHQIVDQGAENNIYVLSKILLNKFDKEKRGRKAEMRPVF